MSGSQRQSVPSEEIRNNKQIKNIYIANAPFTLLTIFVSITTCTFYSKMKISQSFAKEFYAN